VFAVGGAPFYCCCFGCLLRSGGGSGGASDGFCQLCWIDEGGDGILSNGTRER